MIDDVFCKIISKELSADIVMEEERWLAFKDIHPQAPVHVLIIPKEHIGDFASAEETHKELMGELMLAAGKVAGKLGLSSNGYRLIINQGRHGGQLVPHLHIHLLGGKPLGAKIVKD